jgi:hypothetical protein
MTNRKEAEKETEKERQAKLKQDTKTSVEITRAGHNKVRAEYDRIRAAHCVRTEHDK